MAILDILMIGLMSLSLAVVYKGLTRDKLKVSVIRGNGPEIIVEGRKYKGYVITIEGWKPLSLKDVSRLVEIVKSLGAAAFFVTTMIPIDKSVMLAKLEDEIRSLDFKYYTTKLPRYATRLELLRRLYREVSRVSTPYASTMHIIVLTSDGGESLVEPLKRSIEVEFGVNVKVSEYKGLEHVIGDSTPLLQGVYTPAPPPLDGNPREDDIIVGRRRGGGITVLKWPSGLEAHMAVFGPTGRGKTVLLAGIAAQLPSVNNHPYSVVVVDPKGDLAEILSGSADEIRKPRSRDEIPGYWSPCKGSPISGGLIVYDLSGAPERYRGSIASAILESLVNQALERGLPGRIVSIVDEAWRLKDADRLMKVIAREGRSRGLHLVYSSQLPDDIPKDMISNTRVYVAFGSSEEGYLDSVKKLGFNDDTLEELKSAGMGEAALKIGERDPEIVSVFPFHEYLKRAAGQ